MCCGCLPRFCVASHVLCSVMYIGAGAVQLVAGIFFLISLPVFKVGSNVWTGVWNVVVGVGGAVFSSVGDLSPSKHRILLYLTISVLVLNLINLVVLELGEWRILMPDKVKATLQHHNLQTLVLYARMTTSISSALAAIIAFVDAQFMFCWLEHTLRPHSPLDHKETVSDIEYIIPRAKSGSMGKNNPHNLYDQYAAQSWVFDTDTVGSTHSNESPYGKIQQFSNSKTVVLRRKSNTNSNKLIVNPDESKEKDQVVDSRANVDENEVATNRLQPVVLVEDVSNNERHLQYMTSFSRTPSPVQPNSESSSPCSNPAPIYECLERLTEPSVYRSRLNTALEANIERPSPSASPRPHSVVASDQEQYASLMVELERTIVAKFPQPDSSRRPSQHKNSASDADFSRELEAALQLIQDLESPNTVETPSDAPQLGFQQASELATSSSTNSKMHNDRTYHSIDNRSNEDRSSEEENSWSSSSREALHRPIYGKEHGQVKTSQLQPGASDLKRKHTTVIRIRNGADENVYRPSRVPKSVEDEKSNNEALREYSPSDNCIVSKVTSRDSLDCNSPSAISKQFYDSGVVLDHSNSEESIHSGNLIELVKTNGVLPNGNSRNDTDYAQGFTAIREEAEDDGNKDEVETNGRLNGSLKNGGVHSNAVTSSTSRSNSLKRSLSSVAKWRMFPKRRTARFVLTPELESTILKSESLLHLSDVELVARYDRNKSIQRRIEEKAWQKIIGASSSDSTC